MVLADASRRSVTAERPVSSRLSANVFCWAMPALHKVAAIRCPAVISAARWVGRAWNSPAQKAARAGKVIRPLSAAGLRRSSLFA